MAIIAELKNKDGVKLYPITKTSSVYNSNNQTLDTVISTLNNSVTSVSNTVKNQSTTISNHTKAIEEQSTLISNNTTTINNKENKHDAVSITLTVASWSNLSQTVSVTGVTANNSIIITPAPNSFNDYCKAGVYCSAQASGSLTFKCAVAPTVALTVNVMIMGG